jgi:hypothetical protein
MMLRKNYAQWLRFRFVAASLITTSSCLTIHSEENELNQLPQAMTSPAIATGAEPEKLPTQPADVKTTPIVAEAGVPCDDCVGGSTAEKKGFDWKKVPPIHPLQRPGYFQMPPTGCGYYSFLDVVQGRVRPDKPKSAYPSFALMPTPLFDVDFRYLEDPGENDIYYGAKRIPLGENWLFSTGGTAQIRSMHEHPSRLGVRNNDYALAQILPYFDLWYQERFRVFAEMIYADSIASDLPPLTSDRTKVDFQNLFLEAKIMELGGKPVYARVGRQELTFGSQRMVSAPPWSNTRRTFNAARVYRQSDNWDLDAFWGQVVVPNVNKLDSVDNNQNFAGLWATYKGVKNQAVDLYYLFLDNTNKTAQGGVNVAPDSVSTVGSRYHGDKNNWLWDVEGAYQFGSRGAENISSGMFSTGAGYHFKDQPLNPTFWLYYDYASGDKTPNSGTYNTYNQLYPFAHYYLGWLDVVGRQNIQDINMHLYLYPTKWITFWTQFHHFMLDSKTDNFYGEQSQSFRRDPSGRSGRTVGNELDFILNFHISAHSDLLAGYSKLYAGDYLKATSSATRTGGDSDLWYVQYTFRW